MPRLPHAVALVAIGAMTGSLCRWALIPAADSSNASSAIWTAVVNISGCLAMGVLIAAVERNQAVALYARPALGSGFLGGFTSFSAFAASSWLILDDARSFGQLVFVSAALAATALGCILAAASGYTMANRLIRKRGSGAATPTHSAPGNTENGAGQ